MGFVIAHYAGIKTIRLAWKGGVKPVRKWVKQGVAAAMAVCDARDMANEPANYWTPEHFAKFGQFRRYRCVGK